ncbi:hypothetical protein DFQ30_009233 [Apophysomyces sp. BC1015]|nr:hypothetical protein DFQ30_009233 [Apophysomyces sp. BC1015]
MRLLLIEDDRPIARGIQSSLEQAGFTVDMVHDGIFAEQALTQNRHELVILDLGLPGIDGMTLLARFRQTNRHTPVIVLTARDELNDRVQGLNSGADDYMIKPFEPAELEARIRAVMRRSGSHGDMPRPEVCLGGLRLSGVDRRIFNDDKPLELSPREFAVLEMLLLRHGRVVSKAQLQDHLTHFGGDLGDTAIEVYVHRVRKKLEHCRVEIVTSLRRSLLRKLAAPLSLLALMSGLVAYWLAWEYTERVVDRSMVDLASAIARQVELSGPDAPRTVPPLTHAMFSDPVQQLLYRVSRGEQLIAGDPALPLQGTRVRSLHYAYVFDARYNDSLVRVAQVRVEQANGDAIIIEVGQHVTHGYQVAAEFLVAIMVPLLILLLAGWAIVWRVVNQQLNPLTDLADSLNRQTHRSLEPVDETHVPLEIRPLTSALNALLDRLKTALDAQRKFIADAAHQLRTPLTAVKLHAEQAGAVKDSVTLRLALHDLRSSADRAVRLSNQLLSLARAEPEEQTARFVNIDLTELAFDAGAEWVPRALAAQLDLGFHHDPPVDGMPLIVRGNPHNGAPDELHGVGRPAVRGGVELIVEDNGPGVPKALHADLFKRFFRGDAPSGSEGPSGAGLGLAIVRDIIVLHGGTVHYEDGHDGGSRFIVRLPLSPSATTAHDDTRGEPVR